jgi:hypothetical protein
MPSSRRSTLSEGDAFAHRLDARARVQCRQCERGGFDLRHADACVGVQDLPLQVAAIDHVVIGDAQRADAGRGQVIRRRRAQPTRADQQHARGLERLLALQADIRQAQVPRIALAEIGIHVGALHRQAGGVPGIGAAFDGGQVAIAARGEDLCDLQRASAALADQQDLHAGIREMRRGVGLQRFADDAGRIDGHPQRAFMRRAHVHQHGAGTLARVCLVRTQDADLHAAIIVDQ